jgi:hypothetical protein
MVQPSLRLHQRNLCASEEIVGDMSDDFYCRYYVGHKGRFGHEYMEFEITSDGRLRYANNSNYKNDTMIRKEGTVSACITFYTIQSIIK